MSNFVFDVLNFYNRGNCSDDELCEFILKLNYNKTIIKSNGATSVLNNTKTILRDLAKKKQVEELNKIIKNIIYFFNYNFDMENEEKRSLKLLKELDVVIESCYTSLEWGVAPKYEAQHANILRELKEKENIQKHMIEQ